MILLASGNPIGTQVIKMMMRRSHDTLRRASDHRMVASPARRNCIAVMDVVLEVANVDFVLHEHLRAEIVMLVGVQLLLRRRPAVVHVT